jgi:hypothetical protein
MLLSFAPLLRLNRCHACVQWHAPWMSRSYQFDNANDCAPLQVGWASIPACTVHVFDRITAGDHIGSTPARFKQTSMHVTNGIPLGCSLLLPVHTVICVQTLKVAPHNSPGRICRSRSRVRWCSPRGGRVARRSHVGSRFGSREVWWRCTYAAYRSTPLAVADVQSINAMTSLTTAGPNC